MEREVLFNENLKRLRESRKITQTRLSELLNVDQSLISKYERGGVLPDAENLIKLSEIFHVTIDDLLLSKNQQEFREDIKKIAVTDLNRKYEITYEDKAVTNDEVEFFKKYLKVNRD